MKSILLSLGFYFAITFCVNAQKNSKTYVINPGETFSSIVPISEVYQYPRFESGSVLFKDGHVGTAMLNYNRFFQEIMYVDKPGDTLAIASPQDVKVVYIGNDEFYFLSDRFLKIDTTIGVVRIASASFFSQIREKEVGQYGKKVEASLSNEAYILPSSTAQIGQRMNSSPMETVTLIPRTILYITDNSNRFQYINKKTLTSIFKKQEDILKNYLADKKPSFDSMEDMIALLNFMKNAGN